MKLWKIMLAALICVLMLSAVAMAADAHVCSMQRIEGSEVVVSYRQEITGAGKYAHIPCIQYQVRCNGCFASEYRMEEGEKAYCSVNWGTPTTATCTAKSYKTGACTVCGKSYTEKVADEADHDWNRGQHYTATCQKGDYYVDVCMVCGKVKETVGQRVDCVFVANTKIADATCKAPAKFASVCKWCGDIQEGTIISGNNKAACDYAWTVTIEPTCTTKGNKTGVCKVCGGKTEVEVAALGHKADYSTEVKVNATCTAKGYKSWTCYVCNVTFKENIDALGHDTVKVNFKDATCGAPGNYSYYYCKRCPTLWDAAGKTIISAIPTIPANDNHILYSTAKVDYKDCTASNNYAVGTCKICGKNDIRVYVPAKDHNFPKASNDHATPATVATCTKDGSGVVKCTDCGVSKNVVIAALGHDWTAWEYGKAATCTSDLVAQRFCKRCNPNHNVGAGYETKVVEAALGHNWVLEAGKDATCTAAGTGTRVCTRCLQKQQNVTIPAKGHNFTKTVETVKPTCDAQGYTVFGCAACDATQKGNYTAALGHNYSWVVVTKPSEAGNGKNEYTCALCKKVADTKVVKYTKYYYNNTMTSFGPTTKELVGGNDWYRVTPVDLTVDGVYTYDLIASNKYVVGKVTIAVNAGTLTVSYKANGVDVKDEALLIYASKADLATGTAVTAPVGAAINAAETFGADSKVLVSLILTGDYDAAGKGLVDASAAAGMIANID